MVIMLEEKEKLNKSRDRVSASELFRSSTVNNTREVGRLFYSTDPI